MSDTTNATVATAALSPVQLPLSETTVIGVFWKENEQRALIRSPSGQIVTVSPGDDLGGATVTAIAQNGLYLVQNGQESTLVLLPA